jgi:hypothetical protein
MPTLTGSHWSTPPKVVAGPAPNGSVWWLVKYTPPDQPRAKATSFQFARTKAQSWFVARATALNHFHCEACDLSIELETKELRGHLEIESVVPVRKWAKI